MLVISKRLYFQRLVCLYKIHYVYYIYKKYSGSRATNISSDDELRAEATVE